MHLNVRPSIFKKVAHLKSFHNIEEKVSSIYQEWINNSIKKMKHEIESNLTFLHIF